MKVVQDVLRRLRRRWLGRRHSSRRPAPREDVVAVEPDPPFLGCGWFDSSHELRAGLAVVEFEALDAAAVVIEGAAV